MGKKLVGRGKKGRTPTTKTRKKYVRRYHRYIQKKFSPSIMSDVILNLSETQKKWVSMIGFGALLDFRMLCYTHNLGYNVVEAFNGASCSLVLQAGNINITDSIVHSVIGLPNGIEVIKFSKDRAAYSDWGQQFPGCKSSEITPSMVRNKILESPRADENFKWNFMILMYNFFIESNQNNFLTRDVLRFSGDIENCGKYNWCQLMIEKLKKTHSYWAEDTKRNFAGPLPFLIYLYVSKVQNKCTTFVPTKYPTYRGWSDMLLRDRQRYDTKKKCFGEGEIVKFRDVIVDGVLEIKGDEEHECFCHWISIYNVPKEREIMNLVPRVVRMGWQTTENFFDCGIFVMRHMETYMGNLYRWKVGLRIEKDNQKPLLNKLRIIYCHRILTWTENCKRNRILESAAMFGKAKNLVG